MVCARVFGSSGDSYSRCLPLRYLQILRVYGGVDAIPFQPIYFHLGLCQHHLHDGNDVLFSALTGDIPLYNVVLRSDDLTFIHLQSTISSAQFVMPEDLTPEMNVTRRSRIKLVLKRIQYASPPSISLEGFFVIALTKAITKRIWKTAKNIKPAEKRSARSRNAKPRFL